MNTAAACSRVTSSTPTCPAAPPEVSCRVEADIPLDFDTLQPHGCFISSAAIVVLSDKDKASKAAVNLMKFFHDESCGKCTPCRVGTGKAVALMEQAKWNQPLLNELTGNDGRASICGLVAAPNPALSVMKYFAHEIAGRKASTMERIQDGQLAMMPIEFKLNGETVVGRPDEPIITTARSTASTSRTCAMAATSARTETAAPAWWRSRASGCSRLACCRFPTQGMEVTTNSSRALTSQKMVLELLSDMPEQEYTLDNKLKQWAHGKLGVKIFEKRTAESRPVPSRHRGEPRRVSRARCVRACREVVNDVIGYAGRGEHSKIVFDFDDPMGESTCVACGECVQACPTGAPHAGARRRPAEGGQDGRLGVPVLRRGACSPTTSSRTRSSS